MKLYLRATNSSITFLEQLWSHDLLLDYIVLSSTKTVTLGTGGIESGYGVSFAEFPTDYELVGDDDYTVNLSVTTGNTNISVRTRIHRVNSSGVIQNSSDWSALQQATAGNKVFTFTDLDLGWTSGDRLVVEYEFRNTGKGNQSITFSYNANSTWVETNFEKVETNNLEGILTNVPQLSSGQLKVNRLSGTLVNIQQTITGELERGLIENKISGALENVPQKSEGELRVNQAEGTLKNVAQTIEGETRLNLLSGIITNVAQAVTGLIRLISITGTIKNAPQEVTGELSEETPEPPIHIGGILKNYPQEVVGKLRQIDLRGEVKNVAQTTFSVLRQIEITGTIKSVSQSVTGVIRRINILSSTVVNTPQKITGELKLEEVIEPAEIEGTLNNAPQRLTGIVLSQDIAYMHLPLDLLNQRSQAFGGILMKSEAETDNQAGIFIGNGNNLDRFSLSKGEGRYYLRLTQKDTDPVETLMSEPFMSEDYRLIEGEVDWLVRYGVLLVDSEPEDKQYELFTGSDYTDNTDSETATLFNRTDEESQLRGSSVVMFLLDVIPNNDQYDAIKSFMNKLRS